MTKKKSSPPPKQTPESIALTEAIERSGKTLDVIGEAVGVSPGFISQCKTGRRKVPAALAQSLATYLDVRPEVISRDFAALRLVSSSAAVVGGSAIESDIDARRPDMALRRAENDIKSLRYAVAALAATMVVNRPREAREAAAALRKKVEKKFLERGFLFELLKTLDAAG